MTVYNQSCLASTAPVATGSRAAAKVVKAAVPRIGNFLTYSNDPTNAIWVKAAASITSGAADPLGGTAAWTLIPDATNVANHATTHSLAPWTSVPVGSQYTGSFYAKAAGYNFLTVRVVNSVPLIVFNLGTGTIDTLTPGALVGDIGGTIAAVPGQPGWYFCTVTVTAWATFGSGTFNLRAGPTGGGPAAYTGDGVSGISIFRPMLNEGANAQPYIDTTSAQVFLTPASLLRGKLINAQTAPVAGLVRAGGRILQAASAPVTSLLRPASKRAAASSAPAAAIARAAAKQLTGDYQFSTLNMAATNAGLATTEGFAYDAPYLYVAPHNEYIVAKIDTRTFTIVATVDLSLVNVNFIGLSDCFVSDGYLYILPHFTSSGPYYQTEVIQIDLSNFTTSGVDSLHVIDSPSSSYTPRDGFSDGVHGYVNIRWPLQGIAAIRFGLGANFTTPNVSILELTSTTGSDGVYPIVQGNFICCDATNVYGIATVAHVPASDPGGRQCDVWLVSIPIADWQVSAAVFTRLTHQNYPGSSIPVLYQLVDDGTNLWTFPVRLFIGPLAGQNVPPIKIPKAAPSTATITTLSPPRGTAPDITATGQAIYDGWRYGYCASAGTPEILRLDTLNPGVVDYINFTPYSSTWMWGLASDGYWAYASSFSGGNGLCLRFRLTAPTDSFGATAPMATRTSRPARLLAAATAPIAAVFRGAGHLMQATSAPVATGARAAAAVRRGQASAVATVQRSGARALVATALVVARRFGAVTRTITASASAIGSLRRSAAHIESVSIVSNGQLTRSSAVRRSVTTAPAAAATRAEQHRINASAAVTPTMYRQYSPTLQATAPGIATLARAAALNLQAVVQAVAAFFGLRPVVPDERVARATPEVRLARASVESRIAVASGSSS